MECRDITLPKPLWGLSTYNTGLQATADRHSTGYRAFDHRELTEPDRRAVALVWWYEYIQRLTTLFCGLAPEVARHDKGDAVFLPETFTLVILDYQRERLGKLVISWSRFVRTC